MVAKIVSAANAVAEIADGSVVAVNSSSGLCCPDAILKAMGLRFAAENSPRDLTMIHPIAAGDMFGTPGVDHISEPGQIARIIGGSYPSGPSNADPPKIWQRILAEDLAAYNVPSGIIFDMLPKRRRLCFTRILRVRIGSISRRSNRMWRLFGPQRQTHAVI